MPVPVFCCLFVPGFPHIKIARKFWENHIKNQRFGSFGNHQRRTWGGPPVAQAARGRGPPLGRAGGAPRLPGGPPATPLRLYIHLFAKTLKTEPFFMISPLFRRHSAPKIGSIRRLLPGTLPEGGITSGSFSTTMDASRMCRE